MHKLPKVIFIHHRSQFSGASKVLLDYLERGSIDQGNSWVISFDQEGELITQARRLGYQTKVIEGTRSFTRLSRSKNESRPIASVFHILSDYIRAVRVVYQVSKVNPIDLIFANTFKSALVGGLAGRFANKPVLLRLHGLMGESTVNNTTKLLFRLTASYLVNQVLAVSDAVKNSAQKIGVNANKISTIYNGIEIDPALTSFDRTRFRIHEDDFILVVVGRICEGKNQLFAVKILASLLNECPQMRLILVGDNVPEDQSYLDQLNQYIVERGMHEQVIITGFIPPSELYPIISGADIILHPSRLIEALPTNILEGIALKTFVVATRTGGVLEIITDEQVGEMFQPDDSEACRKIIMARVNNPAIISDEASAPIIERFSMSKYIRSIDDAIIEACQSQIKNAAQN